MGGGCSPKGLLTNCVVASAFEDDVFCRMRLMSTRGGAGACGVIIGTWAKAKGVGGSEGVSGGELYGSGEEAAVAPCEDATDEGRGPVAIGGLAAGDVRWVGGGDKGVLPLTVHLVFAVWRRPR